MALMLNAVLLFLVTGWLVYKNILLDLVILTILIILHRYSFGIHYNSLLILDQNHLEDTTEKKLLFPIKSQKDQKHE